MACFTEILSVLVAFAAIFYTYFKVKYQYWKRKNVPVIEPRVPYGSFESTFNRTRGFPEYITEGYNVARKNNWNYIGVYTLDRPLFIPADLDLIKNIMTKDFNYFVDRGIYINEKDQPISAHLFAIGGVKWRNLRMKLTPTFTSGKMRVMFQTLADCGVLLEDYLNEISGKNDGVDIKNLLGCFSTDIIGSVAFGIQCNTIKEPNSPFRINSKKIFDRSKIDAFKMTIAQSFPNLARMLGFVTFPKDVEKFFTDIVQQTVEYREKNNVERKDFLQLLIDIKNNKEGSGNAGDGTNLTMDEIVAQSFVFFIAGFETSATTMTFGLFELANNQKVQEKVREEILRILKKHNGQISYDSLKEMEYLQQVIDETLRMYPPVPIVSRQSVDDYKVPDCDLVLDKGTRVLIPVKGIHYDETIYPNPTVFDPDRFSADQKNSRHQYAHLPFGEGPRNCIGMRFGLMQTKVGLVSILKNHKVTLNEKTQVPLKLSPYAFIPNVLGGIWLNIEKEYFFREYVPELPSASCVKRLNIGNSHFKLKYQYWKNKGAPFIPATAPFGSFQKSFTRTKGLAEYITDSYHSAKEKNWNCFGVYIKDRPLLIIVDLELVKNVMSKDFKHFADKGMYINEKDQPLSAHLFALGGKRWKTLRAKLTPTFTSGKMRTMFQTLADCGILLEKYMEEISGKGVAIDIKNVLGCFSTDIIGSVAFGLECNTLKEQNSPFRHYSNKIFDRRNINRFNMFLAQSFPNLARAIGIVMFPRDVEKFFTEIICETVNYREENKARRNDFLQLLIDIRTSRGNGEGTDTSLTMNEIIAQSCMFFVAGYETSSTTMTFALYELAVHQDMQDKAKAEIQRVLEKHNGQITYDSLKEMEYLQQVIYETLRIYPPVPILTRMCVNDYKVPGSDLIIDKGTRVIIPVKGIHHDETIYSNPSVFDPDRFSSEEKRSRDQFVHIPFGEGPRVCIGLRFGIMQTKVGLVSILNNHRVSLDERTQMPLKMCPFTFTPVVSGGIWLNIQKE